MMYALCPKDFPIWARTYDEALAAIETGLIDFVSFDHDLGTDSSGYDIACQIEALAAEGAMKRIVTGMQLQKTRRTRSSNGRAVAF